MVIVINITYLLLLSRKWVSKKQKFYTHQVDSFLKVSMCRSL